MSSDQPPFSPTASDEASNGAGEIADQSAAFAEVAAQLGSVSELTTQLAEIKREMSELKSHITATSAATHGALQQEVAQLAEHADAVRTDRLNAGKFSPIRGETGFQGSERSPTAARRRAGWGSPLRFGSGAAEPGSSAEGSPEYRPPSANSGTTVASAAQLHVSSQRARQRLAGAELRRAREAADAAQAAKRAAATQWGAWDWTSYMWLLLGVLFVAGPLRSMLTIVRLLMEEAVDDNALLDHRSSAGATEDRGRGGEY